MPRKRHCEILFLCSTVILALPGDQHAECEIWAGSGECDNNPGFMLKGCAASCREAAGLRKKAADPRPLARPTQTLEEVESLLAAYEGSCIALDTAQDIGTKPCHSVCASSGDHADCHEQCKSLRPTGLHAHLQRCAPWPHISSEAISPGLHMVCVLPVTAPACTLGTAALLVVFTDGRTADQPLVLEVPKEGWGESGIEGLSNTDPFMLKLEEMLGTRKKSQLYQRSALFTPEGRRMISGKTLLQQPLLFMYEGGQWIWPTVRVGHTVVLPGLRSDDEVTHIRTISQKPSVFEIENFLKSRESEYIVQKVNGQVFKSGVQLKDADKGRTAKEFRTSSQQWLPTDNDDLLSVVDARIQNLTRVPIIHAEHIQVLRYDIDEHYSAHHDYFDPKDYAKDPNTLRMVQHGAKNRLATVFFYLTDVEEGGATNFPRAGGGPQPHDFFDCSKGFSSYPKKNKVIIFYSMRPDGEMDPYSLHGGCDVKKGLKWSANFWVWNKPNDLNRNHKKRAEISAAIGAVPAFKDQPVYRDPDAPAQNISGQPGSLDARPQSDLWESLSDLWESLDFWKKIIGTCIALNVGMFILKIKRRCSQPEKPSSSPSTKAQAKAKGQQGLKNAKGKQ